MPPAIPESGSRQHAATAALGHGEGRLAAASLIGATLLISAIGFYELFIKEIHRGEVPMMPAWLEMHDLNDLKNRVIAMIVLVLSVSFVEAALDSSNGLQILELGGGFALVIIALAVFIRLAGHSGGKS